MSCLFTLLWALFPVSLHISKTLEGTFLIYQVNLFGISNNPILGFLFGSESQLGTDIPQIDTYIHTHILWPSILLMSLMMNYQLFFVLYEKFISTTNSCPKMQTNY